MLGLNMSYMDSPHNGRRRLRRKCWWAGHFYYKGFPTFVKQNSIVVKSRSD